MLKIFKYKLTDKEVHQVVRLPEDAKILKLKWNWMGDVSLWAIVNPEKPEKERVIEMVETGKELPALPLNQLRKYICSTEATGYSLHVFEIINS